MLNYRYTILVSIVVAAITTTQFQNCNSDLAGVVNFSSDSDLTNKSELTSHPVNGDYFDGKPAPGNYTRTFPDFSCSQKVDPRNEQAKMVISTTSADLIKDNCENTTYTIAFTNSALGSSSYNGDFVTYLGAIFEKSTLNSDTILGPTIKYFAEAMCQFRNSEIGVDVVIRTSALTGHKFGRIYFGRPANNWSQEIVSDFSVDGYIDYMGGSYIGQKNNFKLEISNDSSNGMIYSGNFMSRIDGTNYNLAVACRKMSAQSVLPSPLIAVPGASGTPISSQFLDPLLASLAAEPNWDKQLKLVQSAYQNWTQLGLAGNYLTTVQVGAIIALIQNSSRQRDSVNVFRYNLIPATVSDMGKDVLAKFAPDQWDRQYDVCAYYAGRITDPQNISAAVIPINNSTRRTQCVQALVNGAAP